MSADRPSADVTDNPPSTPQPSQDKREPQPQDFRADRERNDAVVRKLPMQRVPDARTEPLGRAAIMHRILGRVRRRSTRVRHPPIAAISSATVQWCKGRRCSARTTPRAPRSDLMPLERAVMFTQRGLRITAGNRPHRGEQARPSPGSLSTSSSRHVASSVRQRGSHASRPPRKARSRCPAAQAHCATKPPCPRCRELDTWCRAQEAPGCCAPSHRLQPDVVRPGRQPVLGPLPSEGTPWDNDPVNPELPTVVPLLRDRPVVDASRLRL